MYTYEFTMFGLPQAKRADVMFFLVGYEATVGHGRGTVAAPLTILTISDSLGTWVQRKKTYLEDSADFWTSGIMRPETFIPGAAQTEIAREIRRLIRLYGKKSKLPFIVTIGGEHLVTPGVIRALPKNIAVVQFDSHLDLDRTNRVDFGHASAMYEVEQHIGPGRLVSYGIRSNSRGRYSHVVQSGDAVLERLRQIGKKNVYITIDVDAFDSSIASTGYPEPDGLTYRDVTQTVHRICQEYNVLGVDVVEHIPGNREKDVTIARLIWSILTSKLFPGGDL